MKNFVMRNRYLFVADFILCYVAYAFAIFFVFPRNAFFSYFTGGISQITLSAVVYLFLFTLSGIYTTDWVYAGTKDYIRLISGGIISGVVAIVLDNFVARDIFFPKFNIAATLVVTAFLCIIRFSVRILYKSAWLGQRGKGKRIIIVGAGRLAVTLLRDIYENPNINYAVLGLIDDDPTKQRLRVHGTKVLGTSRDISRICRQLKVDEIIFAIHNLEHSEKLRLLNICSETGKKVKILPGVQDSIRSANKVHLAKDIEIEDLLERSPVKLDNKLIESDISGKVVLVTGGGGSIGSELCRQILKFSPKKLIVFDIYENSTFELQGELRKKYPEKDMEFLIGSVRDEKRLDEIFETYKPQIVFHAAAHKHVPLMEDSPKEAIKNNVFGTYNTALAAQRHKAKRFVLISTDKAVNPTNIMGATKRMCEMIVQTLQNTGECDFVAVRFGNVLGSNGSVIPSFKKQIAAGGPVTVTHPDITRFFMTIPEAASLVLQAASYAKGGEIFVLDMGEPVKIYDLAKKMILLSGFKPDVDIKIEFIGLRPGEKLFEELLMNEEGLKETVHSKIFVGKPIDISYEMLNEKLELLKKALEKDNDSIKKIVSEVVPTYKQVD